MVVRDDDVFAEERLGLCGLIVVLAETHVRGLAQVAELQLVVLRSDMQLLASSQVALLDRLYRPPVGTVLPVVAPEFQQRRTQRLQLPRHRVRLLSRRARVVGHHHRSLLTPQLHSGA